ncbi:hypothetical protein AB1Y20_007032 [Prymnesium parvum]|uniref:Uncharacterized protein n=1 Tax=Prymnesium parvum TaxID=97485 RepID=A0AB34J2A4_PRYPA
MSTLAPGASHDDRARGIQHTHADYHTPDGNGRASAPEGVDAATESAVPSILARSDAKSKRTRLRRPSRVTRTRLSFIQGAGGRAAEIEPRNLGGPSNFSANANANAITTDTENEYEFDLGSTAAPRSPHPGPA